MGSMWIPENKATRIPRAHICLDSEALITKTEKGELHGFRTAVTSVDRRSHKGEQWVPTIYSVHNGTKPLWEWVGDNCKPRERTVLVAHNLAYDLRVTGAFQELPASGWELGNFSLAPGATWMQWHRGKATMQMVDTMTWLPTSLANIGTAIGLRKLDLPKPGDSDETWIERCRQDVVVLREAWLRIIAWLKAEDLGNFRPTGAGQSWSAWRHRHMTHPILVHDDSEIREKERKAAWTGRAEAWRFGKQSAGPFTEWDFSNAYAEIALTSDVPTRLIGEVRNVSLSRVGTLSKRFAVLCDITVTNPVPTLPTLQEGRILWPVGQFSTSIWENELHMALLYGADVTVEKAWVYEKAPALKQWAEWVLGLVNAPPGEVDPIVKAIAKHWCRALIGRFGTRYSSWEDGGTALHDYAMIREVAYANGSPRTQELEVGGKLFMSGPTMDHKFSAPQVMSWIMAQCRVNLWEAMNAAGLERVLYVDTDSLIVDDKGSANLERADLPGLRRKARYQSLDIVGTRRLIQDRQLKAAGVPRGSVRTGARTWTGESWQSLLGSLRAGVSDSVRVGRSNVELEDRDNRRQALADGSSTAYEINQWERVENEETKGR